jgi:SHO1 osmosensor
VAFGGSCALAFTGAGWWIVVFELLVVVGVILLVLTGTFLEYRLVVSDDETYRVAVLPTVDVGFPLLY